MTGWRHVTHRVVGDVIEIPLTKGYVAIIDRSDAHLAEHRWQANVSSNGVVYAMRFVGGRPPARRTVMLHRAVMGDECVGLRVDHIDGDGLNNRRGNLRAVNETSNQRNRGKARIDSASGVLGVGWHSATNRWYARIKVDGRRIYLGLFDTIEDAAAARLEAEKKFWGIQPRRADDHEAMRAALAAAERGDG